MSRKNSRTIATSTHRDHYSSLFRSRTVISSSSEVVFALVWGEDICGLADGAQSSVTVRAARRLRSALNLEKAISIEVGAVGWQEAQRGPADRLERRRCGGRGGCLVSSAPELADIGQRQRRAWPSTMGAVMASRRRRRSWSSRCPRGSWWKRSRKTIEIGLRRTRPAGVAARQVAAARWREPFFLKVMPRRWKKRHTVLWETRTPCALSR